MTTIKRDLAIDIIRGIAIFTMIAANMTPIIHGGTPFLWRFYGTWAAPAFTFIVGAMIAFGVIHKKYDFKHFFQRATSVIFIAVILDVLVFRIIPFCTVDVLYLIGISFPLTYLFLKLKTRYQIGVIVLVLTIAPLLRHYFGYTAFHNGIGVTFWGAESALSIAKSQTKIFHHWFIDGFFPVFPWIVYPFVGALVGKIRWETKILPRFDRAWIFLPSLACFALFLFLFLKNFGNNDIITRGGYSELFYAPKTFFVLASLCLIISMLSIFDKIGYKKIFAPLIKMGQASLEIYIAHYTIIECIIHPVFNKVGFSTYIILYLILLAMMITMAYVFKPIKQYFSGLLQKSFLITLIVNHQ